MPFLQEIFPSCAVRTGIWHITETAAELLSFIQLSESENNQYQSFGHDLRKRQWLASRALLKCLLFPNSSEILYDINGKPFLTSGSHQISVTHAGEFAAAVCAENFMVGIDIEKLTGRVERVKERFMLNGELESLIPENRLDQLYIYWCGKEALYKLHGKPELDFRNDIYIHPFDYLCHTNHTCKATLTVDGSRKDYTLYYQKIEAYMLVVAF